MLFLELFLNFSVQLPLLLYLLICVEHVLIWVGHETAGLHRYSETCPKGGPLNWKRNRKTAQEDCSSYRTNKNEELKEGSCYNYLTNA